MARSARKKSSTPPPGKRPPGRPKGKPLSAAELAQRRAAVPAAVAAGVASGRSGRPKGKPLSAAELAQRRAASPAGAAAATGPTTEEGKARTSRNAWKHGLSSRGAAVLRAAGAVVFTGRPCRTTCQFHPCTLVQEGLTAPGGDCLDKTVYLESFDALMEAMRDGRLDGMHTNLAMQTAGALELLHQLRQCIAEEGILVRQPMVDKNGEIIGHKVMANPALGHYTMLLDKIGLSLPELMATPKAVSRLEDEEDAAGGLAQLMGDAFKRLGQATKGGRVLPGQAVRVREEDEH